MAADLNFRLDGYRINIRVGAMIWDDGELLICQERGDPHLFLPGGRVQAGETSVQALRRELREELGETFEIKDPLLLIENFFEWGSDHVHEICMLFEVTWTGSRVRHHLENPTELLIWVPRRELAGLNIKPSFLRQYLIDPPQSFQHVVHRDKS
jgi:8-oxo-dGTP pyrophosphatase MutT (NUDIX family)